MNNFMDSIFFTSSTSISHIFSNVTSAIEMYLKSNLPPNLLKDSTISTRTPFRYFKRYINTKDEFKKKERPFMIIRPTFEPLDTLTGNNFLCGTKLIHYDGTATGSGLAIQKFFYDPRYSVGMGFKINRCKMNFDVAIQFNSYYAALEIMSYLKNTLAWGITKYVPTSLESLIPSELLIHLCEIVGVNIDDPKNIPSLTRYLRNFSSYPITYKMRDATSRDAHFLYYPQNILTTFEDLSIDEAQRKNMVEDSCAITFKIECEFNVIASYILYGKKGIYKQIKLCMHDDDNSTFTPIYTYDRLFNDTDYIDRGYSLFNSVIIKSDPINDGKDEEIDITPALPAELKTMIDDMLSKGNDISTLLIPRVIFNNIDASDDTEFDINWSKYTLTIYKTNKLFTYRFILYVNLGYYNDYMIKHNISGTDQQNLDGHTVTGYDIKI